MGHLSGNQMLLKEPKVNRNTSTIYWNIHKSKLRVQSAVTAAATTEQCRGLLPWYDFNVLSNFPVITVYYGKYK